MRADAKFLTFSLVGSVVAAMGLPASRVAGEVTFPWATVGDAGNAADSTGFGAVPYVYQISKTDVSNSQYVQFLNAVDATGGNRLKLFSTGVVDPEFGVALNPSAANGNKYAAVAGKENHPVVEVTWTDAARFVNWLSNGQGGGGTESGVYDMSQRFPGRAVGASVFLPNENEWYKAAYYDPSLNGGAGGYWKYATRSNTAPGGDAPPGGANSANYMGSHGYALTQSGTFRSTQDYLTDVGAYAASMSAYGTFDQTGDVRQWNEDLITSQYRPVRGGSWAEPAQLVGSDFDPVSDDYNVINALGFRVAGLPEPATASLMLPLAALLVTRRRRLCGAGVRPAPRV